jgi:hypothetical protein
MCLGRLILTFRMKYTLSCTLKMKASYSSETLIFSYQTTRRHIPEDSNLNILRLENFSLCNFDGVSPCITPCNVARFKMLNYIGALATFVSEVQ